MSSVVKQSRMEVIGTDFENWGPYLMKQFQLMYEKGEKCDLEISCNKQIFLVHRLIMSACSEYVKELEDKQHIILPEEVSCKALKMVLDFVYTGKIVYNKEEKDDLLLASNLLNMRLLSELIKMEESCSFTLSMDDESEERPNEDGSGMNVQSHNNTETEVLESTNVLQTPSQSNYKKRSSEVRSRPRSSRNSVLPPLHKFPYLQQKFSASRTYGLITTLTKPVPSRFEIPLSMMSECSYRFSFEDVSYETQALFNESESFQQLEEQHLQFLKKNRETSNHRRNYSNALYSPFDKYTPPYTVNNESTTRKRENTSYLAKPDPIPPKKSTPPATKPADVPKYHNKNIRTNNIAVNVAVEPPSLIEVDHPNVSIDAANVEPPSLIEVDHPNVSSDAANVEPPPLIGLAHLHVSSDAAIALQYSNEMAKNKIPEKAHEIVEVPSIENGEKVELIKLNNAVVTSLEEDFKIQPISEELPDISISVIDSENSVGKAELVENSSNDITSSENTAFSADFNVPPVPEMNNSVTPQPSFNLTNSTDKVEESFILPDPANKTDNQPDSIPPDTTQVIPQNTDMADVPASLNSQIIVKTKGTENSAQLTKIVEDLCKKNPLFKNKNVLFKLVPVNGPIPDILKDQARINKAILVKKTDVIQKTELPKDTDEKSKKTESIKLPSIENITGPWECKACGDAESNLRFDTYFEYRTHLHNIHGEPNNPMYCIHCGYKSLKRNMQIYHLFTKHNVVPPSSFKFPKCDKCEFYALNDYSLQKHLSSHPNDGMQSVCACKVAFKNSEALQKHIASGDCKNSKTFTCDFCRCLFDRFVNLKAHVRICKKERSKQSTSQTNEYLPTPETTTKTVSEGGKDYLAL